MKKLIPVLVSGFLLVGIFGCQEATKTGTETPGTTNEAGKPAKEATQKTATTVKKTTDKSLTGATNNIQNLIGSKLKEKIPGSKLSVENKSGVVTVTGTVPTEADLKKIEPLVKQLQGIKSVKVEAKVAAAKP